MEHLQKDIYPEASLLFDWALMLTTLLWAIGAYVDGYVHGKFPEIVETFFTSAHVPFYLGIVTTGVVLFGAMMYWKERGYDWKHALPQEYMHSLWGVGITLLGGIADIAWHAAFGFETGISESILSPPHILLAAGSLLAVSGPMRKIWYGRVKEGWAYRLPVVMSVLYVHLNFMFLLQIFNIFNFPWPATTFVTGRDLSVFIGSALSLSNAIIYTVILVGLIMVIVRQWRFPRLMFTIVLTLSTLAGVLMMGDYYGFVFTAFVAGRIIDWLYRKLAAPAVATTQRLRHFFWLMPFVIMSLYTFAMFWTGVWMRIHAWGGLIVMASIFGYLMTYVMIPPGVQK